MFHRIFRLVIASLMLIAALSVAGCASRQYDGQWEGATSAGIRSNSLSVAA